MGREGRHRKNLEKELKNHPGMIKLQMLLTGKLATEDMLRILEHASKCRECYDKLIRDITRSKNPRKRR
jgi:hypothetical protein